MMLLNSLRVDSASIGHLACCTSYTSAYKAMKSHERQISSFPIGPRLCFMHSEFRLATTRQLKDGLRKLTLQDARRDCQTLLS